jgi:transcriptional regulator with XRE-family HTH domain
VKKTTQRPAKQHDTGIGKVLRRLRKARKLSVRGLATQLGFSASFISQIENQQASPSIASLERIATTLGVTLRDLFSESHSPGLPFIRAADRPAIVSEWSKARIEALSLPQVPIPIDAILVDLQPGGSSGKKLHAAPSHRFAFVSQGTVTLSVGEVDYRLKRGDAITLPAGSLHRWTNLSRSGVRVLIVSFRAS